MGEGIGFESEREGLSLERMGFRGFGLSADLILGLSVLPWLSNPRAFSQLHFDSVPVLFPPPNHSAFCVVQIPLFDVGTARCRFLIF